MIIVKLIEVSSWTNNEFLSWHFFDSDQDYETWKSKKEKENKKRDADPHTSSLSLFFIEFTPGQILSMEIEQVKGIKLKDLINIIKHTDIS